MDMFVVSPKEKRTGWIESIKHDAYAFFFKLSASRKTSAREAGPRIRNDLHKENCKGDARCLLTIPISPPAKVHGRFENLSPNHDDINFMMWIA